MKREFFAVIKFFAGAYCVLSLAFFIAFMSIGTADQFVFLCHSAGFWRNRL